MIDNGSGMTPDVMARAIEPFYTSKEVGKGTGLGLSMVHGFVSQSGGAPRIESWVRDGTRVTLLIPAAVAEAPVHRPSRRRRRPLWASRRSSWSRATRPC